MRKFPKQVYLRFDKDGNCEWLCVEEELKDLHGMEIGVYKLCSVGVVDVKTECTLKPPPKGKRRGKAQKA